MAIESPLVSALDLLQDFGFFRVVLPLILIFALVFGILEKTKIFGDDKSNINAVIAFVIAFFTISSTPVVEAMNDFLPQTAMLLVVALMALMLFAFVGLNPQDRFDGMGKWAGLAALLLIIIFLGVLDASLGWKIPIIHEGVEAFTDSGEDTIGGSGAGGVASPPFWETEAFEMMFAVLLLFLLPLIVVFYIVRSK